MTDQPASPPPPPPEPQGMQFDRAEAPQPSAPAAVCAACKNPVTDVYYLAGQHKVCPACREAQQQRDNKARAGRVVKGLLLGLLAAVVGGSIWAFITYKSNGTVYGI